MVVEFPEKRSVVLTRIEKLNHALSASTFAWLARKRVQKIGVLIRMGVPISAIRNELALCDLEVRMVEFHARLATL